MILLYMLLGLGALFLLISLLCFFITFYNPKRTPEGMEVDRLPPGKAYEPYYDAMNRWHEELNGMPREEMEITSADANGAVKVSIAKLEQNALLMTAFYDSYGRLIGTKSTPVTSGSVTAQCTAELNGTPASVRVFLLDPSTRSPLSASDSVSVG